MTGGLRMDLKAYAARKRRMALAYPEAVRRGMVAGVQACVALMHAATRSAPPANPNGVGTGGAFNYGNYLKAWRGELLPGGGLRARIYNTSPYAAVIEWGRRAGAKMPPEGPLIAWILRKLAPRKLRGKAKQRWAEGLAYVIRRAIKKRGLIGRQVMTSRKEQMNKLVRAEIDREVLREMNRK